MTGTIAGLRERTGDALIAVGELVRGGTPNLDEYADVVSGRPASITPDVLRSALDDLADSELLRIAATVIAGWKPILLTADAAALTDVDLFIATLRDRADQFEAVEFADANPPYPVDSTTRTCCGGIGRHTHECASTHSGDRSE